MFPVAMFGVMRAGGVASLSSPAYGVDEMVHVLRTVESRFVMCSSASLDIVRKAARVLRISEDRIFILDGEIAGFESVGSLVTAGEGFGEQSQVKAFQIPSGQGNSEICSLLCFSSGTTGLPKAVSPTSRLCSIR
jgi:4-coumarate--CoA ligase